jgi:hypothetical protein
MEGGRGAPIKEPVEGVGGEEEGGRGIGLRTGLILPVGAGGRPHGVLKGRREGGVQLTYL